MVAVDLNQGSETFRQWCSAVLTRPSQAFYVPKECAVGTLALTDSLFICACGDNVFIPEYDTGIRWNDKEINIKWPIGVNRELLISEKDAKLPLFCDYS